MNNKYKIDENTIKNSSKFKKYIYIKYGIYSICIVIIFIIFILLLINLSYKKALKNYKKENYKDSYSTLSKYPNYKKSSKYLRDISYINLETFKVGDIVYFGSYKGKIISWQILEIKDNKFLLISNGKIKLEDEYETWKTSNIRDLLNNDFYYNAFNEKEKNIIMPYYLDDEETIDKLYILNEEEAEKIYNISDNELLTFRDEYSYWIEEMEIQPVMWVTKEKYTFINQYDNGYLEGLEEKDIYKTSIGMYDYLLNKEDGTYYYWKDIKNTYYAKVNEKDDIRVIVDENIDSEAINDILEKRGNLNEK